LKAEKLTVVRRFDLSAPNSVGMAFFSKTDTRPCKMFWALQNLKNDEAKILALWFNSTFNISQILAQRAETRGAFMGIAKYILEDFWVLDPTKLNEQQKKLLIETFDKYAKKKLPSILEQLKSQNLVRKKIDLAILKILDLGVDSQGTLNLAYEGIARRIENLATLMKEK
jgi:hypothetical protein